MQQTIRVPGPKAGTVVPLAMLRRGDVVGIEDELGDIGHWAIKGFIYRGAKQFALLGDYGDPLDETKDIELAITKKVLVIRSKGRDVEVSVPVQQIQPVEPIKKRKTKRIAAKIATSRTKATAIKSIPVRRV